MRVRIVREWEAGAERKDDDHDRERMTVAALARVPRAGAD